jgi:hypothetical protein
MGDYVLRTADSDVIWIEGEPSPLRKFRVAPGQSLWLEEILWTYQRGGR